MVHLEKRPSVLELCIPFLKNEEGKLIHENMQYIIYLLHYSFIYLII